MPGPRAALTSGAARTGAPWCLSTGRTGRVRGRPNGDFLSLVPSGGEALDYLRLDQFNRAVNVRWGNVQVFHSRISRIGLAVAATSMSMVGVIGATASPAWASFTGIKCSGLSGNISSTVTLSGCNGNTGGGSMPLPAASLASGGTITWLNSDTTTVTLTVTSGGVGCPAKNTLYTASGKST